jgi:hypothetical protein
LLHQHTRIDLGGDVGEEFIIINGSLFLLMGTAHGLPVAISVRDFHGVSLRKKESLRDPGHFMVESANQLLNALLAITTVATLILHSLLEEGVLGEFFPNDGFRFMIPIAPFFEDIFDVLPNKLLRGFNAAVAFVPLIVALHFIIRSDEEVVPAIEGIREKFRFGVDHRW